MGNRIIHPVGRRNNDNNGLTMHEQVHLSTIQLSSQQLQNHNVTTNLIEILLETIKTASYYPDDRKEPLLAFLPELNEKAHTLPKEEISKINFDLQQLYIKFLTVEKDLIYQKHTSIAVALGVVAAVTGTITAGMAAGLAAKIDQTDTNQNNEDKRSINLILYAVMGFIGITVIGTGKYYLDKTSDRHHLLLARASKIGEFIEKTSRAINNNANIPDSSQLQLPENASKKLYNELLYIQFALSQFRSFAQATSIKIRLNEFLSNNLFKTSEPSQDEVSSVGKIVSEVIVLARRLNTDGSINSLGQDGSTILSSIKEAADKAKAQLRILSFSQEERAAPESRSYHRSNINNV